MADLTIIATALNSLKTATDIARFLRESDLSLEKAELKLKLADLMTALADAKISLAEVQESLAEKDGRISELAHALESKAVLTRYWDAYYRTDEAGNPVGEPLCLRCWESDHRIRQLVYDVKDPRTTICTNCGQRYESRRTRPLKPGDVTGAK